MATENDKEQKKTVEELSRQYEMLLEPLVENAMLPKPATAAELAKCNKNLKELDFPPIPADYAAFLKVSNGYAFDSVELYGTYTVGDPETGFELTQLEVATDDFNEYYVFGDDAVIDSEEALLCIGRQNGDYFTWNPETEMYEVRSHEMITELWEEYDSFEKLFRKEVIGFSGEFENDDDGRYDAEI